MKKNKVYLNHILDCVHNILSYTDGLDESSFSKNFMVQDAVIRNFQIIGEATKRIEPDFETIHQHIPWKKMAGIKRDF